MSDLLVVLFLGMLWARVSDVGIAEHGWPSLAVPAVVGLIGLCIVRRLRTGERITASTFRGLFPLLPYLLVVGASTLWATSPLRTLSTAADLTKDLLIFWVLVEMINTPRILKYCCLAVTLVAGGLSALSVYQQMTGTFGTDYGGFAQASVRQIVEQTNLYRLAGPVGDPNYYALILLVTVPIGLALLRTPLQSTVWVAVLAAVALSGGAVLLTYSRGGAAVLALGVVLSLVRFRSRARLLAPFVVGIPLAVMLVPVPVWERMATLLQPFQDSGHVGQVVDGSVELRLGAQRIALEMFLDSPFGGAGAGNYPLLYQEYSRSLGVPAVASEFYPHNLYLQVAAETGSLGLLTFLPAVFGPLVALEMTRRATQPGQPNTSEWRDVAAGVAIALGCYLAASMQLHASYPRYLWMLLALVVAARRVAPTQPARM